MKMDVNNKVAIVTGALGGIGFATIQCFLRNGAKCVVLFDLPEANSPIVMDRLAKLQKEFAKETFEYYKCNVADKKEFIGCYEEVLRRKGYIDILVNNAGIFDTSNPDLLIDVNVKSAVNGTLMAIDRMGTENRQGVIVNLASVLGLVYNPLVPLYSASKHAVVAFVRTLKDYGTKLGVRVVCICPKSTTTDMCTFDNIRKNTSSQVSDEDVRNTLINIQRPENVASAIVDIVQRGKNGDVWVVGNNEPAFNVGYENDLDKLRIPF